MCVFIPSFSQSSHQSGTLNEPQSQHDERPTTTPPNSPSICHEDVESSTQVNYVLFYNFAIRKGCIKGCRFG